MNFLGRGKSLFRVSIGPIKGYSVWESRKKPFYVIESTKEAAALYVEKHLKSGFEVEKVSLLGPELSGIMFGGN